MNITKQLLVLGVAGLVACNARANFVISEGSSADTIYASTSPVSGTLDFTVSFTSTGTTPTGSVLIKKSGLGLGTDAGSDETFSSLSFVPPTGLSGSLMNPETTTAFSVSEGSTYTVVVDWTLPDPTAGDTATFDFDFNYEAPGSTTYVEQPAIGTINIIAASVPEPTQTIAGGMLLGCGCLVFAGRRLFKKQAA